METEKGGGDLKFQGKRDFQMWKLFVAVVVVTTYKASRKKRESN